MSRRGRPSEPKTRLFRFFRIIILPIPLGYIGVFFSQPQLVRCFLLPYYNYIFNSNYISSSSSSSMSSSSNQHPDNEECGAAECSLAPSSSSNMYKPAGIISTVETSSSSSEHDDDERGEEQQQQQQRVVPQWKKQSRRIRCNNIESVGRWALLGLLGTALFGSIYTNLSCRFLSIHFDDDEDEDDTAKRMMMELFGREDMVTVGIFGYDDGTSSMSSTNNEGGGLTWETYSLEDCIAYPSQFYKTPLGPFWAAGQFASFLAAVVGGMAFLLHLVGILGVAAPNHHLLAPLLWLTGLAVLVQGFTFVVYGDLEACLLGNGTTCELQEAGYASALAMGLYYLALTLLCCLPLSSSKHHDEEEEGRD